MKCISRILTERPGQTLSRHLVALAVAAACPRQAGFELGWVTAQRVPSAKDSMAPLSGHLTCQPLFLLLET